MILRSSSVKCKFLFDVVQIIADGRKIVGFNYVENAFDASDIMTIL